MKKYDFDKATLLIIKRLETGKELYTPFGVTKLDAVDYMMKNKYFSETSHEFIYAFRNADEFYKFNELIKDVHEQFYYREKLEKGAIKRIYYRMPTPQEAIDTLRTNTKTFHEKQVGDYEKMKSLQVTKEDKKQIDRFVKTQKTMHKIQQKYLEDKNVTLNYTLYPYF